MLALLDSWLFLPLFSWFIIIFSSSLTLDLAHIWISQTNCITITVLCYHFGTYIYHFAFLLRGYLIQLLMASTLQYAELLLKGLNCKLANINKYKRKLNFHPVPNLFLIQVSKCILHRILVGGYLRGCEGHSRLSLDIETYSPKMNLYHLLLKARNRFLIDGEGATIWLMHLTQHYFIFKIMLINSKSIAYLRAPGVF